MPRPRKNSEASFCPAGYVVDRRVEDAREERRGGMQAPDTARTWKMEGRQEGNNKKRRQARSHARTAKYLLSKPQLGLQASKCLDATGSSAVSSRAQQVCVYGDDGRIVVYRSFEGERTRLINYCLQQVVALVQKTHPPSNTEDLRSYLFSVHEGSTGAPELSEWTKKNLDVMKEVQTLLEPARWTVEGIFKHRFPDLYSRYTQVLDRLSVQSPELQGTFFPFASFAIEIHPAPAGQVSCKRGLAPQNASAGLCVVIPFGEFDPTTDGRIVLEGMGSSFEVGPGVPLLFPPGLYTHHNSGVLKSALRGSLVAWTEPSLLQWAETGSASTELEELGYSGSSEEIQFLAWLERSGVE